MPGATVIRKTSASTIPLAVVLSGLYRLGRQLLGRMTPAVLAGLLAGGLMLGPSPASGAVLNFILDSPHWVDGIPQFIGVTPFSDPETFET